MIAHLVVFETRPDVDAGQLARLAEGLRELTAGLPYFVRYECGPALGIRQGADFGVLAILHTAEDVTAYLDDPRHVDFVQTVMAPLLHARHAVQIDLSSDHGW